MKEIAKSSYTKVHQRMMRYVFLQTELLLNDDINELSEYDIQSMIFTFFRSRLDKYQLLEATREQENRTDIVVHQKNDARVYLELKTYFKKNKRFKKVDFDHDLSKLLKKAIQENSRAYFIIAGISSNFNEDKICKYDFLTGKYLKLRDNTTYRFTDKGEEINIDIRPSAGEGYGKSRLWSWEIMKPKKLK